MLSDTPVAPAKMAHFVLVSTQKDVLVDWYKTVLACEEVFASERITFLTFDDEHHRLAIAQNDSLAPRPAKASGVAHIAFSYAELDQLLSTYARLKAADIVPGWCVNHGMSTSMYYRDPDGNQIELQVDNFATAAEGKAAFASPAFAANTAGIDFDPDRLLERRRAGTPVAELLRPDAAPVEAAD